MYSPQIHQEVGRQRQSEMLAVARRERVAATAAAAKPDRPGRLGRIGSTWSSIGSRWHARVARRERVVDAPA